MRSTKQGRLSWGGKRSARRRSDVNEKRSDVNKKRRLEDSRKKKMKGMTLLSQTSNRILRLTTSHSSHLPRLNPPCPALAQRTRKRLQSASTKPSLETQRTKNLKN